MASLCAGFGRRSTPWAALWVCAGVAVWGCQAPKASHAVEAWTVSTVTAVSPGQVFRIRVTVRSGMPTAVPMSLHVDWPGNVGSPALAPTTFTLPALGQHSLVLGVTVPANAPLGPATLEARLTAGDAALDLKSHTARVTVVAPSRAVWDPAPVINGCTSMPLHVQSATPVQLGVEYSLNGDDFFSAPLGPGFPGLGARATPGAVNVDALAPPLRDAPQWFLRVTPWVNGEPGMAATSGNLAALATGVHRATFATALSHAGGTVPSSVAAGDLNGDGVEDVLVSSHGAGTVTLLPGATNGVLGDGITVPAGLGPERVVVANLDGDGLLDAAVCNHDEDGVTVMLSLGRPQAPPSQLVHAGINPYALMVADVDADGAPDLVTVNEQGNSVSILLNVGLGHFAQSQEIPVGRKPRDLAVADVNGDGLPDFAVANYADANVTLLLSSATGAYASHVLNVPGTYPQGVVFAQLNGDEWPDLVVTLVEGVSVHAGQGQGGFGNGVLYAVGARPLQSLPVDLDGDGTLDLVVVNNLDSNLSLLLGRGDGTFFSHATLPVGLQPRRVAAMHLNSDTLVDLVTANSGDETVSVLLSTGSPPCERAPRVVDLTAQNPTAVAVMDVNGDGNPDLLTVEDGFPVVRLGRGAGLWAPAATVGERAAGTPQWITQGVAALWVVLGDQGGLWRLKGDATTLQPVWRGFTVALAPRGLMQNGVSQWVLVPAAPAAWKVWQEDAAGLAPLADLSGPANVQQLLWLDVDGDGQEDLITANAHGAVAWGDPPQPIMQVVPPVQSLRATGGSAVLPKVTAVDGQGMAFTAWLNAQGTFEVIPEGAVDVFLLMDARLGEMRVALQPQEGLITLNGVLQHGVGPFHAATLVDVDLDGTWDVVLAKDNKITVTRGL